MKASSWPLQGTVCLFNKNILIGVAIFEGLLVFAEAGNATHCHYSGDECWPFFFAMLLNMPASLAINSIVASVDSALSLTSFWSSLLVQTSAFLVFGTLWWSALLHVPWHAFRYVRQLVRARSERGPSSRET